LNRLRLADAEAGPDDLSSVCFEALRSWTNGSNGVGSCPSFGLWFWWSATRPNSRHPRHRDLTPKAVVRSASRL